MRQALQGHIGSTLSRVEGGRRERQRAWWEAEEDLVVVLVSEEEEAPCPFLMDMLALRGPRLAASLFMVSWAK